MSLNQGSISVQQKKQPSGPPFVIASANNGLSVDPVTGKIVLGQLVGAAGDPAKLLDAREIPINLKSLDFRGSLFGATHLTIDNKSYLTWLSPFPLNLPNEAVLTPFQITASRTGTGGLALAQYFGVPGPLTNGLEIGTAVATNVNNYLPGSFIQAKGADGGVLNISSKQGFTIFQGADLAGDAASNKFLSIDRTTGQIVIGDIDGVLLGGTVTVDNFSGATLLAQDGDMQVTNVSRTKLALWVQLSGGPGIAAQMGDISGVANGTRFLVDDTGQSVQAYAQIFSVTDPTGVVGSIELDSQLGNVQAQIGDISNTGNGSILSLVDSAQQLAFNALGSSFFSVDAVNHAYQLGLSTGSRLAIDEAGGFALLVVNPGGKGNFITVDDTNDKIEVGNVANNVKMKINGVNGFTGTVTPVTSITVEGGIVTAVS